LKCQWQTYESIADSVKSPLEIEPQFTKLEPDINLYIMEKNPNYEYSILMSSAKNQLMSVGQIKLEANPKFVFRSIFKDTEYSTNLPGNVIVDRIRERGMNLYAELFPSELKERYWKLQHQAKSMRVVSSEPWIPWELITPWRRLENGEVEEDGFLCERFAFSRWFDRAALRVKEQKVRKIEVIIPSDTDIASVHEERD
jgi:hypothetical protein